MSYHIIRYDGASEPIEQFVNSVKMAGGSYRMVPDAEIRWKSDHLIAQRVSFFATKCDDREWWWLTTCCHWEPVDHDGPGWIVKPGERP